MGGDTFTATMMRRMCFVLIIANSVLCIVNCFSLMSSSNHSPLKILPLQTQSDEPIVLSLPSVLSPGQTGEMLGMIETLIESGGLVSTSSYQEDIFSEDKIEEEDSLLKSIIGPLLDTIPTDVCKNPLEAFVYAVTKYQDRISEENIILGANIIQRRQAVDRWKSEDGLAIMKLSADYVSNGTECVDWDSISLGKRYQLPPAILNELEKLTPRLLKGSWTTQDATVVKYCAGDSQVPHIDPCDATLLICLKSCEEGGDTCFPLLGQQFRLENKAGSGILFFSSNKIVGDDSRDTLSLHHGGKVLKGEKVVVQLMLEWCGDTADASISAPESWFDVIVDAS